MKSTAPSDPLGHGPLIFAIGSSRDFGEQVAAHLGTLPAPHEERGFEDGEYKIRPLCNVRNRDVYVIHSLHGDAEQSPSDKLCRLLFLLATLRDAAAARVTAITPYLCFSRKDRQTKARDPVTTRYVAQLFEAMGIERLVTMEVHNPAAFQNAFRCDTDHLDANMLMASHIRALIGDAPAAVLSPDPGGVKRADIFREVMEHALGRPVAGGFMEKHRSMGRVTGDILAGNVAGRNVVVIDDLISSGGTMGRVAQACQLNGASRVFLAATHGVFSTEADEILAKAPFEQILVTNTVAWPVSRISSLAPRLSVIDVAPLFAEAIRCIHTGGSITDLLGQDISAATLAEAL